MFAALLTVLFFSISGVAGERSARYFGGQRANLLRLTGATVLLGMTTLVFFPDSLRWETFGWLFFSGIIGFGIGDVALFLAYVRLGARLTILLNLCTAPLWGALLEWLWLGTTIGAAQMGAGGTILAGVALALNARAGGTGRGSRVAGVLCGLTAGCGQGMGAVVSRKAFEVAAGDGFAINGLSAAAQRVSGGLLVAALVLVAISILGRSHSRPTAGTTRLRAALWLAATTLCGPVLGVACFQWSLIELPAGIAAAVVATTPVAMIPLALAIDRERPNLLSLFGATVAVTGVILMLLLPHGN